MSSQGEVNSKSTCIIAIETATEACSAALLISEGEKLRTIKCFQLAPREHTKLILPMLDEVLDEADLTLKNVDAIAFGRGPGAFTGLRIAAGIAQGLALSVDKPIVSVSSLMAMAAAALKENKTEGDHRILVAIDARMGEVYWAEYKANGHSIKSLELVGDEQLSTPSVLFEKTNVLLEKGSTIKPVSIIGSGWDVYLESLQSTNSNTEALQHLPEKFPDAEEISQLALLLFERGEVQTIEEAQPVYLRNNVAEKSKKVIV